MEILFKIFLVLHILGGSVGLVTGTINLIRRKGDRNHRLVGKLFSYGMLTAGFSALVLSILHVNNFLFIVGVFTIYQVGTGYRYIYLKMLGKDQKPKTLDWALTIAMLLMGGAFIIMGVTHLISKNNFGIVFLVFGFISLRFVRIDFGNYNGKIKAKNYWLLCHIQRMTGGYIAAVTAFLVVNGRYLPAAIPSFVVWLLPTAVLVPLIFKWTKKYYISNG